jgi:hypothetical protein
MATLAGPVELGRLVEPSFEVFKVEAESVTEAAFGAVIGESFGWRN